MTSVVLATTAALGAAAMFGLASALQHREAGQVEPTLHPGLLLSLVKRPLWVLGSVADVGAVGLQAVALGLGSVALVQTLLVAGLPLAVLLSAVLARRGLHQHEVVGLVLCSSGLALLGPALASTPSSHTPSRADAVVAGVVLTTIVLALLAVRGRARFGGMLAGLASGATIGAGSVLLAVCAHRFPDWSELLGSWALYAAVVVGGLGLLLAQVAFQSGDLGAPLAALSVAEPVVSVVLAVTVLHEALPRSGAGLAAAAAGTVLSVAGVLALCRADTPVVLSA
ncbi:MAG: hypothetical protein JWO12_2035 [Frankiales bacterium]|nr:hypothetical protein [Frankiales bacterium]